MLIVGLGNPGTKYASNRHNIGFMAVDRIAADHGFSPWRSRFQGLACEGRLGETRVTLLKPQGFMNLSGQAVGEAMRYLKLTPRDVIVLHDELDLAPGKARVKQGGGHAGHNGLRSIHQHVGADYGRVRLGIGHPGHKDKVAPYVLSDFAKAEQGWLDDLLRGISEGAAALAAGDGGRFQNAVANRTAPARNSGTAPDRPASERPASERPASERPAPERPAPGPTAAAKPAPASDTPRADAPASLSDRLRALSDRFR